MPCNKVVALNWNKLALVSVECAWEFSFSLAYDLSEGLAAVRWVMLRLGNRDTVHSTGPFIPLPWTWGGQRTPTQREKMRLTGRWCVLEE